MKKFITLIALIGCFVNVWGQCKSAPQYTDGDLTVSALGDYTAANTNKDIAISFPSTKVEFDAKNEKWGIVEKLFLYQYVNGSWSSKLINVELDKNNYKPYSVDIDPDATKIKFSGTAMTSNKYIKNLTFTYKPIATFGGVSLQNNAIDLGSILMGQSGTFNQGKANHVFVTATNVNENFAASAIGANVVVSPSAINACGVANQTTNIEVKVTPIKVGAITETITIAGQTLTVKAYGKLNAPKDLSISNIAANGFQANWNKGDDYAHGYQVELSDTDNNVVGTYDATNLSYVFATLNPCTTYNVRVRATANNKADVSEWSEFVTVTTVLAVPENVQAQNMTAHAFDATWNAVQGATGYVAELSDANKANATYVEVAGNKVGFESLTANTVYNVRVKAISANCESAYGDYVQALTLLETPQNLAADAEKITKNSFELTWDAVADATMYQVELTLGEEVMKEIETANNAFVFAELAENTTYTCRVKALDKEGAIINNYSAWSTALNVTTYSGVARIGSELYATLNDAIKDFAQNDEEVVLLDDVNEDINISEVVRLDAQGYAIGNVTVEHSGNLVLTGDITMNDLLIKASADMSNKGSGQISKLEGVQVVFKENATASLEKEISVGAVVKGYWYAIAVPFEVDAFNGVYDSNGNKLTNDVHYLFNYFAGQNRADYGVVSQRGSKCTWQAFEAGESLKPGMGYMVLVDNDTHRTLRMRAKNPNDVFDVVTVEAIGYASANSRPIDDLGWNLLSNPYTCNASLDGVNGVIQVLRNGGNNKSNVSQYVAINAADAVLAPGSAFVMQVKEGTTKVVDFVQTTEQSNVRSEQAQQTSELIQLSFNKEGADVLDADNLFISVSENATDAYEIEKDLVKNGNFNTYTSLWIEAYDYQLAMYDAKLVDNVAVSNLFLNMVEAGSYELRMPKTIANATVYLMRGEEVVHNLSESAYTFVGQQGVNSEYSLRIVVAEEQEQPEQPVEPEQPEDVPTWAPETAANLVVYVQNDVLSIQGLQQGEQVVLYHGSIMVAKAVANDSLLQFTLPAKGLYIVRLNGVVVKVMNL